MNRNPFLDASRECIPRLLGLINKNPLHESYGSFDRGFWLHRTNDFSSGIRQIGCESLAHIWSCPDIAPSLYKSNYILSLCKASLLYMCRLQKSDGSFDEWYPNERGWAGPTGYLIYSACNAYQIIESELSDSDKAKIKRMISKGAHFLGDHWEPNVLSNHIAMALLPIYFAYTISEDQKLLKKYNKLFERFLSYWDQQEGWAVEYDGPDIGYQTATLSFMARLHQLNGCEKCFELAQASFQFLSYFYYPNNEFSLKIGSRHTEVCFVFAAEYWAQQGIDAAKSIALQQRQMVSENKLISPIDHEDHYLLYRLPEYIEAAKLSAKNESLSSSGSMPHKHPPFEKHFEKAGLYIYNSDSRYIAINLNAGGRIRSFYKPDPNQNFHYDGWSFNDSSGKTWSSNCQSNSCEVSINNSQIEVSGLARQLRSPTFTPLKMISFRLFMLIFGNHEKLSRFIKEQIRRVLMFSPSRRTVQFKRSIHISDSLTVRDKIQFRASDVASDISMTPRESRMVPQSCYHSELDVNHQRSFSKSQWINKQNEIVIEAQF